MRDEIVLIGPMGVGKSHMANRLSKKLRKPHVKIDDIRFEYYNQIGFDERTQRKIWKEKGFLNGVYPYWKPFEIYAVKKILKDYSDCVFDFGAGHSVYEDDSMLNEAKEALAEFKNVILLLPSDDVQESLDFLIERNRARDSENVEMIRHFIVHHSNYDLCKHIIYVKDKSEDEILIAIYSAIGMN